MLARLLAALAAFASRPLMSELSASPPNPMADVPKKCRRVMRGSSLSNSGSCIVLMNSA